MEVNMTFAINNASVFNDSLTVQEKKNLAYISSVSIDTPIIKKYSTTEIKVPTKRQWAQKAIEKPVLTLGAAYTAGSGTMTLEATTIFNPYSISAGKTTITTGARAVYLVTSVDGTTVSVSLLSGSDTNLASGARIQLSKNTAVGADYSNENVSTFAISDHNFFSNFNEELIIDNLGKDGRYLTDGTDEFSFAHQRAERLPVIMGYLENEVVRSPRKEGTNPKTADSLTRTSGHPDAMAGGALHYIANNGGYAPTTAEQFSLNMLSEDMKQLRKRGAFRGRNDLTRRMDVQTCDAFISPNTLSFMNLAIQPKVHGTTFLDSKTNGVAGTYFYKWLADGVQVNFHVSDAIADDEILYIPDPSQFKVIIHRLYEFSQDKSLSGGDNEKRMACVTWSTELNKPWTAGYRSGMTTS